MSKKRICFARAAGLALLFGATFAETSLANFGDEILIADGAATSGSNMRASQGNSNSGTAAPTSKSRLLRSSASDSEKMEQSVKLLVPAPAAPVLPRSLQSGTQQTASPNPFSLNANTAPTPRTPAFNIGARQSSPYGHIVSPLVPATPMRLHPQPPGHSALYFAPGGVWSAGGQWSQPIRLPRTAQPRQTFSPPPMRTMTIQVDPWTNLTEAVSPREIEFANLQTALKRLHSEPTDGAKVATAGPPLMAIQKVLPEEPAPKSWDEWYRRVASAIYDRWKQNTAGAGAAMILITASSSRYVDCRVTDFTPAPGADRDAEQEQRFKQVALQCVSSLSGDEVWRFPLVSPVPKKIVFDMEFKHAVGENAGCTVVHLHTGEKSDEEAAKK